MTTNPEVSEQAQLRISDEVFDVEVRRRAKALTWCRQLCLERTGGLLSPLIKVRSNRQHGSSDANHIVT